MTNAQSEDINARLESIDRCLEDLGDELDEIRTIQSGMRRVLRFTSQSAARLEHTVKQLADIVRIQQQEAVRDRTVLKPESLRFGNIFSLKVAMVAVAAPQVAMAKMLEAGK